MFSSIKNYWLQIPEKWRLEITSGSHTVIAAMVLELSIQLASQGNVIPTGKEALIALAAALLRSGQKALVAFVIAQLKENTP